MSWISPTARRFILALGAVVLFLGGVYMAVAGGVIPAGVPGQSLREAWVQVVGKWAGVVSIVLAALPGLVGLWLGSAGWGALVLRRIGWPQHDAWLVSSGLGLGLILAGAWVLGHAGWLNGWTGWGLCAGGVLALGWRLSEAQRQRLWQVEYWPAMPWTGLAVFPAMALILVASCCPPGSFWAVEGFGYDSLAYHLQLPREWLAEGRIRGLEHNVFSYLPDLTEAGYMMLGAMYGSVHRAIYVTHLTHASCAVLAALAVGRLARRQVGGTAAVLATAAFLLVPWTVVAASNAYDEMAALALTGVALLVLFDPLADRWPGISLAGGLLGLASLAKLSVGLLVLPAVAIVVALGGHRIAPVGAAWQWKRHFRFAAVLVLVAVMTVAPWLVRNGLWTGNPLFPFATETLGRAHWQEDNVRRWRTASFGRQALTDTWQAVVQRWLLSPGYGAVGGSVREAPTAQDWDITRFHRGPGFPILGLGALIGAVAGLAISAFRRMTWVMLLMLGVELLMWAVWTHQQARFLLPTVIPLSVLVALGAGALERTDRIRSVRLWLVAVCLFVALLMWNSFDIFWHQGRRFMHQGRWWYVPPYQAVDSLPLQPLPELAVELGAVPGDHVINYLPPGSRTLLVAEAAVFYIRGPITYHSVFDADLLGRLLREKAGDSQAVTRALREAGFTHVWVNWSEYRRFQQTYGYDPGLDPQSLERLVALWRPLREYSWAGLYALP